jgi:DNA-binding transcriptional ArsR family regulator
VGGRLFVDCYLAFLLNVFMSKSRAEKELEDFELVFSALAHEARRRVLVVLLGRKGEMTAGQIVERFHCSWPTMTRHLSVLEEAGLIHVEKRGRERHYILNKQRLNSVVGNWLGWFQE